MKARPLRLSLTPSPTEVPELPEVETVRRGIAPQLIGRRIVGTVLRDRRLRWPVPADLGEQLAGRRVDTVERRAKYLLLGLDNGDRLILHLGMTGQLRVLDATTPLQPHDHVDLQLDDGRLLRFRDPRRFGAVLPWPAAQAEHPLLAHLGPEPLSTDFDGAWLHTRAAGRSLAVKLFIMDAHTVVGVGNIYASESLFRAGIRPSTPTGRLSRPACGRLAVAIRAVLEDAIQAGGTTLRDFVSAEGNPGYFQQQLYVYGREGAACLHCSTPVRRSVDGARSSFWCARCQR